jgi:hypothetical protein
MYLCTLLCGSLIHLLDSRSLFTFKAWIAEFLQSATAKFGLELSLVQYIFLFFTIFVFFFNFLFLSHFLFSFLFPNKILSTDYVMRG